MLCAILMLFFLTLSRVIYCSLTDLVKYPTTHHVDLSRRHLMVIPENIPINTESLDLSHNEIKYIPNGIFANFSRLVILDLSYNQINVILVNSFKGLSIIESLNLRANNLTCKSLDIESFNHITSLKELQIQDNPDYGNSAISLSDELYRLKMLRALQLDITDADHNQLNKFECFRNLKNVSFNSMDYDSYGLILTNTTFTGLRYLPIEELNIFSIIAAENNSLRFFPKLMKLTLSLNWNSVSLEKLFPLLEVFKGRRMTAIILSGNRESNKFTLGKAHLRYLWDICLTELYLSSNYIVDIDASSFSIFARNSTCLEVFDMSDNPLSIDTLFWWMHFHYFKSLKVTRFSHMGIRHSSESMMEKATQMAITFLLPSTLQEAFINYGWSKFGLPNVTFVDGQSMKILSLFHIKLPHCLGSFKGIPNLTELDISGFNCTYLNPDILQFLPRLEKFTAQNTNLNFGLNFVDDSGARLFVHLSNMNYIDISANNLQSIHSDMFKDQTETLKLLNLSHNAFTNIPISINKFKALQILDLSSNHIEYFNEDQKELLEKNNNIDIILSGNPFLCSCDHTNFLKWIKERGKKYFVNIECIGADRIRYNISEIINSLDNFEINCIVTFWLYFAIIVSSLSFVSILFFSIYYRYRSEIQYFFLKLRINMKRYNALEPVCEYQFDAFISYSSSDSSWVAQFYRKLTDNGFNVCIDAKDFIAGDGIAENIVRAIDSSRKIIFIVTRNFLKSSWGGYEIEMTRMHAFREGRENMVIIIIKDEIAINEMPRTLKEMWNKIVCLKYNDEGETIFYDTLAVCLR